MYYSRLFKQESTKILILWKEPYETVVKAVPLGDGSFCNPHDTGYYFERVGYSIRYRFDCDAQLAVEDLGNGVYRTKINRYYDDNHPWDKIEITFELIA